MGHSLGDCRRRLQSRVGGSLGVGAWRRVMGDVMMHRAPGNRGKTNHGRSPLLCCSTNDASLVCTHPLLWTRPSRQTHFHLIACTSPSLVDAHLPFWVPVSSYSTWRSTYMEIDQRRISVSVWFGRGTFCLPARPFHIRLIEPRDGRCRCGYEWSH